MSDQENTVPEGRDEQGPATGARASRVTLAAAAVVLLLALGATLWPRGGSRDSAHTLLVFDASGSRARMADVFVPLRDFLGEAGQQPLVLVTVRTLGAFRAGLADQPDFVLAPDGLAVEVPGGSYLPFVVGRRSAPQNLRPRGVLVYRISAGYEPEPWRVHPAATVFGDSVSLAATGVLRQAGLTTWPRSLVCGPDSYDHSPVLHALRLGAFDYAVVRQWDAERFFAEGLLAHEHFAVRELLAPVPDSMLLVSRQVPKHVRLVCGEECSGLGRNGAQGRPGSMALRRGLAGLHLTGFNLLLEPDLELVRKNYPARWLRGTE